MSLARGSVARPNGVAASSAGLRHVFTDVTPEVARQWLSANVNNRPVRRGRVSGYARDMAAGAWALSPQGIAFDVNGNLMDGQHRLLAVIEAGVTVKMLVWFDVPQIVRDVLDIGDPRELRDVAKITRNHAAVTLAMMRGPTTQPIRATMAERLAFYRRFSSEINDVVGMFPGHRKGITQASVLGAIARAALHMRDRELRKFCHILWTGEGNAATHEKTVMHLRDRLLLSSGSRGGRGQAEFHGMALSSLRAFHEGRTLTKIYPATSENDPFPLPEVWP